MRRLSLLAALAIALLAAAAPAQISQGGSISTAGADCLVATNCVVAQLRPTSLYAVVQLSGPFVADLRFEGSADGAYWFPLNNAYRVGQVLPPGNLPVSGSVNAGAFRMDVAGLAFVRVRAVAIVSGNPSVMVRTSENQQ